MMDTRKIHVRDLSIIKDIKQYEHCVQQIYFLGLEDYEGTVYMSVESDEYTNEGVALENNTYVIGQPLTSFNTTYYCQLYAVVNDGEKIQLSNRFRLVVDKSNDITGESYEYPIDPNLQNGIDEYIADVKEQAQSEIEATGDAVIDSIPSDYTELESRVDALEDSGGGLTDAIRSALLQIAQKVAYIDENGQSYYDDLYDALYAITALSVTPTSLSFSLLDDTQQLTGETTPSGAIITWTSSNTSVATVDSTGLVTSVGYGTATITASCQGHTATCSVTIAQATVTSISAVYTQSGTVYDTATLDSLKSDLVVTANWSNGTTSTVASADYTLSGTLAQGTSTITVSYGGKSTTFNVEVVQTYTSSTGKEYTKTFTIDAGRKYPTPLLDEYGLMENLENLTITGQIVNEGSTKNIVLPNLSTYAPNLKRFIFAPTSLEEGNVIKFGHYQFNGIPASLTYLQLGHVNSTIYWGNGGYFRNNGDTAGLSNKYMVGNTNGLELVVYTDSYKATNGGFNNGTTAPTTTITQYLYTDGSPLTA